MTKSGYRPDIDGLRALAVLFVVAFHAFPTVIRGGFIGVDVFFVISGFLITGILLRSLETGEFRYGEFIGRRVRRIFPALLVVLVACLAAGPYLLLDDEYRQLGKHVAAGGGFASNFLLWGESGYFDDAAESKPLLHLWSLGIEEQFYLGWPLLLAFGWMRQWRLSTLLMTAILGSFAVNLCAAAKNPIAGFYSPLSRLWEMMLGAFLAHLAARHPHLLRRAPNWQSILGLAFIVSAGLLLHKDRPYPGWAALLPTFGTCLIIASGPDAWLNRRILGHRGLVAIGLISYPLYLWHWPLLSFIRIWDFYGVMLKRCLKATSVLAAMGLAYATYRFVEKPVRRLEGAIVTWLLAGGMLLVAVSGFRVSAARDPQDDESREFLAATKDRTYPASIFEENAVTTIALKGQSEDTMLFVGDSHMSQYLPAVKALYSDALPRMTALFVAFARCAPSPKTRLTSLDRKSAHLKCDDLFRSAMRVAERPAVRSVVFAGNWDIRALGAYDGESLNQFGAVIRGLVARGKNVVVVLDNPQGQEFDPKSMLRKRKFGRMSGRSGSEIPRDLFIDIEVPRRRSLARMGNLERTVISNGGRTVDPYNFLCGNGKCPIVEDGKPVYSDSNHLRPFYAVKHAAEFASAVSFR